MGEIRRKLRKPYWADRRVPFRDFNREIIPPGQSPDYPEGAIGIRVDEDFWSAAALPYSYLDWTIERIVADLWPEKSARAVYGPDVAYYREPPSHTGSLG